MVTSKVFYILVGSQLLFSIGDFMARYYMSKYGFHLANFLSGWFLVYFLLRQIAMFGQLYVFTFAALGRSTAIFAAVSIIISNVLGFLLLKEAISLPTFAGIVLAIMAIGVLTWK